MITWLALYHALREIPLFVLPDDYQVTPKRLLSYYLTTTFSWESEAINGPVVVG